MCYTPAFPLPPSLYRANLLLVPSIWKMKISISYIRSILDIIKTTIKIEQSILQTTKFIDILFELSHIFNFRGSDIFFFFCIFIKLVVLIQRNSALRNEALAYLISELVKCLDAVSFSLLVEETAINYGCRKKQKLGEKSKIKFDKAVSPF